ncbi:MAG TPA: electron transport complex subunit RsxC [Firmicutes bacterium]|nr:electron transport complex subunit RsxC [Bacillota bacterium]
MSLTFSGGVHPPAKKELAKGAQIEKMPVPGELIIPMSQHIGAPCTPLVKKGDKVLMGQVIGDTEAFVSAPIHSSVSGEVTAVEPRPNSLGKKILSVVIKNDGEYKHFSEIAECPDCYSITPEELRKKIRSSGIVGLGGATFPTHVKLSPPKDFPIDTVIINGAECEPYLTADYRLMLEDPVSVVEGLKLLLYILNANSGIIAIEDNKQNCIDIFEDQTASIDNIKVLPVKTKYPQGAEKQLIYSCLKRKVPAGGLPMNVGVVVHNALTSSKIYYSLKYGMPLISRIVTVSGEGIQHPKNLEVTIGTLFSDIIRFCGGFKGVPGKIIAGGPMMGFAQSALDVPVTKGTSGILVFPEEMTHIPEEDVCFRCGKCVDVCPMKLMPYQLGQIAEFGDYEKAEEWNAMDCIECGSCSYVCPAKRRLVHYIKLLKADILSRKRK